MSDAPPVKAKAKAKADTPKVEIEPPSGTGITVEFPYSTAATFDLAVEAAKRFQTFKQYGEDKKAIYRATVQPNELVSMTDLVEQLKGWRRRVVYVDGVKTIWDSVFSFSWCYAKRTASFKPDHYCFGYENDFEANTWGCVQVKLPFTDSAQWFCWGAWVGSGGDWKFDKERIRYEIQKALFPYRYCPALKAALVEDALNALPDIVNPSKDKDWKFVERWNDESMSGLVVNVNRFGSMEKVTMKGVSPSGPGAYKAMAKRMRFGIPQRFA